MTIKDLLQKLDITVYKTLFTISFFIGLILTYLEILIYRNTFVNFLPPTLMWILPGLFAMPFLSKALQTHNNTKSFFLQMVFSICAVGGIVVYVFMASNFYFRRGNIETVVLKVNNSGHLAKGQYGCGEPYVDVSYEGVEKELIFPCDAPVEAYTKVQLKIQNGFLGYKIIVDKVPLGLANRK